jgi:two-component system sensor histidine kinase/response regulator
MERIEFDPRDLLDDLAAMLALRAQEKDLEFVCARARPARASARRPGATAPDPHQPGRQRHQIHAARRGGAERSGRERRTGEVALRFEIRDTGIGIPPTSSACSSRNSARWTPRRPVNSAAPASGLAISKRLAEMMGGEIGVVSQAGEGASFWFTARFQVGQEASAPEPAPAHLDGARILVVDDNATSRAHIVERLRACGAAADGADGGPDALARLRAAHAAGAAYRLAIVDMHMPDMDGAELGRRIKADAHLRDTRLVLMTSLGQRGDAKQFEAIGYAAYLSKPMRQADLRASLAMLLADAASPVEHPLVTRHTLREMRHGQARVLVAEDNLINQRVALGMLEKFGVHGDIANNGREVLEALARQAYDLVLMDVQMPEMDGLAAARAIGELRGVELPLLCAMTANATQADRDAVAAVGMAGFIGKPIDPAQLEHVVRLAAGRPRGEPTRPRRTSTAPQTPSAPPATISRRLDEIARDAGDDVANEIAELFLEDAVRLSARLAAATARGATDDARRAAHALRGAASNVGASHLASLAERCERAAGAADATALAAGTEAPSPASSTPTAWIARAVRPWPARWPRRSRRAAPTTAARGPTARLAWASAGWRSSICRRPATSR